MFTCPRCQKDTISWKQKYLTNLWRTINCPQCGTRLTALPLVLLIMHMLYVWNVLWFVALYMFGTPTHDPMWFVYMVVVWVVLDVATLNLVPLAAMRGREP